MIQWDDAFAASMAAENRLRREVLDSRTRRELLRQAKAERIYRRDIKLAVGLFVLTIIYLAGHVLGAHLAGRL